MFKRRPYFIVFEGIEGSGKSYQSSKLFKNLKKKGLDVLITREPGGTPNAEKIRKLILTDYFVKNKNKNFDKYTDTLLYLAARNEHVKNKIRPALKKKQIVICDRFVDSTISYQVYGKKVKKKFIKNIHNEILGNLRPNLTFILKVNLKTSRSRLRKRKKKNRYDNFSNKFYQNAQRGFLYKKNNNKNYIIFDSSRNTPELEKKILETVLKRFKSRMSK